MSDWPLRDVPIAAWSPEGDYDLLAVPLPPERTITTYSEYRDLLGSRVDWMAKNEPDALAILMDVFHSHRGLWLLLSGVKKREWVGSNIVDDDSVAGALSPLVGEPPGKVESDPEAVQAIQDMDLESWAMTLRSHLSSGSMD